MNSGLAESLLRAVDLDVDLEVSFSNRQVKLLGRDGDYSLHLPDWRTLYLFVRQLRRSRIGWGALWRFRRYLQTSHRKLTIMVKGRRRMTVGH